jgi:hypothetical protein
MPMKRIASSRARDPEKHVTAHGYRFGENHPLHRLTLRDVELMRQLHEEYPIGHPKHLGYRRLAKKFNVAKTTARQAVNYKTWGRAA